MPQLTSDGDRLNFYDRAFTRLIESGLSASAAAVNVTERYLDAKPRAIGKHKLTHDDRGSAFWFSGFLKDVDAETWQTEPLVLALTRYLGQEKLSNLTLLSHIGTQIPQVVHRAVRYSGLVLKPSSPRRAELAHLARVSSENFGELIQILEIFDRAYQDRLSLIDQWRSLLAELSPVEILVYASLYAFEHLVPRKLMTTPPQGTTESSADLAWDAINDILIWKLSTAPETSINVTESRLGRVLAMHLSPFLFPGNAKFPPRHDLREAFDKLMAAQTELTEFVKRSADAFSYDDSIRFVRHGDTLAIADRDSSDPTAWARNGQKLARLQGYWFLRAASEYASSELAGKAIGTAENHHANRWAYILAMRAHLYLVEAYGLEETITLDSGERVDLFQAMLSLQLMTAHFNIHFLQAFAANCDATGNWLDALARLAMDGFVDGRQNRLPLTWSERAENIRHFTKWTTTSREPAGNPRMAAAILDFWTSDWTAHASRLRKGETGLHPPLYERPIIRIGRYLFQLPWIIGVQSGMSAAINNLRRLGARRPAVKEETQRIERRLADRFEERGFSVALNWQPPRTTDSDPGEIDLICAHEPVVLVVELKSSFLRRSQRESWLHATTTLRRAGIQLRKKVEAVRHALKADSALTESLGIDTTIGLPVIYGLIVDTSIESDHERFSGFLKVSLDEVLIALRDDHHLLSDLSVLIQDLTDVSSLDTPPVPVQKVSLFPNGFNALRFIEVIEEEIIWKSKPLALPGS